mmetsp:Transcript_31317/g.68439  ORF Transcript_31317/g.68439 Transcript_31317/m.68439 type:complete len:284 (-) Transcript_31317:713-1564(-)
MKRQLARVLNQVRQHAVPKVAGRNAASVTSVLPPLRQSSRSSLAASCRLFSTAHLAHSQPRVVPNSLKLGAASIQRRTMFIQTQTTPNPNSLMFIPGRTVMESGSANFVTHREAMSSPLAKKLFETDAVRSVFFGSDFVTVTKSEEGDWAVLKPEVFASIMDFFASDQPLLLDQNQMNNTTTEVHEDDSEVVQMIKELLDTRIRPAVHEDGGDIAFHSFDEDMGFVYLKMQGACASCPSSSATLKHGIENMLMHYIPEVKAVMEWEEDEGVLSHSTLESKLSH